ncbi:unnamed protein product [marine sediment metagenome]|uniref:Uncharacterized protein n=1 Tax=marine sediment metagenome TaxID=412755 RepID=X0RX58_9ZZZZ
MGQQVNVYRELKMFPGARISGQLGPLYDPGGRTYYVNNITGSATGQGDSWNDAMDEVSTAITASETYRALQATTNEYVRNTIVVQGTDTKYTGLADLGEEYNLIGLASPTGGRGWMADSTCGGVQLGNSTRHGLYDTDGDNTGVYIANIQFKAEGTTDSPSLPVFQTATLDQCCIEDCSFLIASAASRQPTDGILITTGANGSVFRRLHIGGTNAAPTSRTQDGMHISGTIFRNCLVESCILCAQEKAFHIPSGCIYGDGTMVWHNYMGALGHGSCAYGIYDANATAEGLGGHISYVHNFCDAGDPMSVAGEWTRCIMNYAASTVLSD